MKNNKVNKLIARYNQETVDDDESNLGMGSTSYIHHVDQQAGDGEVDYIVNHLRNTASRGHKKSDSRLLRNNNHRSACVDRESSVEGRSIASNSRVSLEDNYCRAMNRLSRGNPAELYYNNSSTTGHDENKDLEKRQSDGRGKSTDNKSASLQNPESRRKESSASGATSGSNTSTNSSSIKDKKKAAAAAAMDKDPSEETIAIFGAYGVTGHHFLQLAMEAGYKIRALLLPGLELDDVVANDSVKLITGSFDEEDKVRRVVKNASYVVCLLNDCERSLHNQTQDENLCPTNGNSNNSHISTVPSSAPSASSSSNLGFFQKLIPILEESKTCRVLLYQASSVALDDKGATPIVGKMVKKFAIRKDWRQNLREQDRIVKLIVRRTRESAFNYIITRPSDMVWDRPSRKKLAASKSLPGPFPITNVDLAEFTLGALRTVKIYNSCPYVVQDGV